MADLHYTELDLSIDDEGAYAIYHSREIIPASGESYSHPISIRTQTFIKPGDIPEYSVLIEQGHSELTANVHQLRALQQHVSAAIDILELLNPSEETLDAHAEALLTEHTRKHEEQEQRQKALAAETVEAWLREKAPELGPVDTEAFRMWISNALNIAL
ncbi:hypothetical protein QM716_10475 [Rhodococcus sp. IEGM 1409]|uniref:hypothetical protein n=1 Tax=Rhodococcus sp. IEGM 1409 TaxID=3047082 RepID=UPI0024B64272|nr:hypothetical protein [Rhodococcus sp. IEGM 1409]MDI9900280.1 hypothetical protein [Rhodococcus sp. IEGM 1409]